MPANDNTQDNPLENRTKTRNPDFVPNDAQSTIHQTPDQVAHAAQMSASGTEFPAIPGYEILAKLGEGGMGIVYRAKQHGLNREVAIKTLIGHNIPRASLARFWAEAEVMAEVKHPNVVQVIELGEFAGKPFMAMEFVRGGSLAAKLRGGQKLAVADAVKLLEQVARGVGAAHELGIIHRDLKPDNVLLDGDTPKVADFGIAKRKSHEVTQTNAIMGTPAYMAPEQAEAKSKFVGPPADVWSLGVMFYESLSGKRPFEGDSVLNLLAKISNENAPALRTVASRIPRDLQTIVSKCLTKEPELRYANATELADDLARFQRGEPILARPVGVAERFARWVRRKPTAAAAWAFSTLAVVLALFTFFLLGLYREADRAKNELATVNGALERKTEIVEGARAEADRQRQTAEKAQTAEEIARQQVEREREKLAVFEYGRTMTVAH